MIMPSLIKECNRNEYSEHHVQLLIILEDHPKVSSIISIEVSQDSSGNSQKSKSSHTSVKNSTDFNVAEINYFETHYIMKMIVVERPKESSQLYMALNLNEKYHFAVPSAAIPALYNCIKSGNNNNVEIEFIPRMCI
jgi:hypothetical protein